MTKIIYKNTKPKYMGQYINWPNVTGTFLRAGTPIAENGTVANNDAALGILANDVSKSDELQLCQLIIAGQLSLEAVESSFGKKLTTSCKDALDDITFVQSNGKPYPPAAELPAVTADDDGKILKVVNGVWAAVSP